jgi:hypothetical protein
MQKVSYFLLKLHLSMGLHSAARATYFLFICKHSYHCLHNINSSLILENCCELWNSGSSGYLIAPCHAIHVHSREGMSCSDCTSVHGLGTLKFTPAMLSIKKLKQMGWVYLTESSFHAIDDLFLFKSEREIS